MEKKQVENKRAPGHKKYNENSVDMLDVKVITQKIKQTMKETTFY